MLGCLWISWTKTKTLPNLRLPISSGHYQIKKDSIYDVKILNMRLKWQIESNPQILDVVEEEKKDDSDKKKKEEDKEKSDAANKDKDKEASAGDEQGWGCCKRNCWLKLSLKSSSWFYIVINTTHKKMYSCDLRCIQCHVCQPHDIACTEP